MTLKTLQVNIYGKEEGPCATSVPCIYKKKALHAFAFSFEMIYTQEKCDD